jgi:hypothetical protein
MILEMYLSISEQDIFLGSECPLWRIARPNALKSSNRLTAPSFWDRIVSNTATGELFGVMCRIGCSGQRRELDEHQTKVAQLL